MEEISEAAEIKKISILIEEPFNFIYTYIKAKQINCDLVLINNSENKNIISYLSTNVEAKNAEGNIYSYINKLKGGECFDFIILQDNHFPDKDTDIIPKTLFMNDKKLINIRNHLNKGGKFCFNLLMNNIYLKEQIENKLNSIFENVDMFKASELDALVICSNN